VRQLVAFGFACFSFTSCVLADDGSYESDALGGIVGLSKTDKVAMSREVLEISPSQIRVELDFVNLVGKDLEVPVMFPLPPYVGETAEDWRAGEPPDFSVEVDGKKVPFRTVVTADSCGNFGEKDWNEKEVRKCEQTKGCDPSSFCRDVTKKLKAVGLSDEQIALLPGFPIYDHGRHDPPFPRSYRPAPSLTANQAAVLATQHLVLTEGWDKPFPTWQVHVNYVWLLRIPANRTVKVVHVYRPLASGGEAGWPDEDRLRDAFCADDAFIRAWKTLKPSLDFRGYTGVPGAVVDYVLKTANTWNGPIRDFTLRLKKGSPTEIVSLLLISTQN